MPEDIFINGKEFLYIYVAMKQNFFRNKAAFIKKYKIQGYDDKQFELTKSIEENCIDKHEEYDYRKEFLYKAVLKFITEEVKQKRITDYDSKCFLLYFYPEFAKEFIQISDKDFKLLNEKPTYRTIELITGINFQSIRYTVKQVLEIVKKNFKYPLEPITDSSSAIFPTISSQGKHKSL